MLAVQSCPTRCDPTVACQAPMTMKLSQQEYWSGLPFPSPGDLPNPGNEPGFPALQVDSLSSEPPGEALKENQEWGDGEEISQSQQTTKSELYFDWQRYSASFTLADLTTIQNKKSHPIFLLYKLSVIIKCIKITSSLVSKWTSTL